MEETLKALDAFVESGWKCHAHYSRRIVTTVADLIRAKLLKKGTTIFTKADVNSIRTALDSRCHGSRGLTLQYHDCFNTIAHELATHRLIESHYINTLIKIPRHLLTVFDDSVIDAARAIGDLRTYLLEFNESSTDDTVAREKEYYCTAFAACVIFGQMTFPGLEEKMFSLTKYDHSIDPAFFIFKFDGGDTYYRYFLPAPAAIYVQRLLLFQFKQRTTCDKLESPANKDVLLAPISFEAGDFPSLFLEWIHNTLNLIGSPPKRKISLSVFRKAAVAASLSNYSGDDCADTYPPFVLAVQSRVVQSFSYDDHYLSSLLEGREKARIDHCPPPRRIPKRTPFTSMSSLNYALEEVRSRIAPLKHQKPYKMSNRIVAAGDLLAMLDEHKQTLLPADFENFGLYVRWLGFMLQNRSFKIKRICGYLSNVPVLLDVLAEEGETIDLLCKSQFADTVSSVMSLFHSPGIRNAIKAFSEYVKFERADFDMPDWQHAKELSKPYIPTPKPLIDYHDIEAAISISGSIFSIHTAPIVRLFIYLGAYAGMRVMEIANLFVHNVILDDGVVICVRTTKTENGVRNIHLSKLAPAWVVDMFLEYWRFRRAAAGMNAFIFVGCDGKPLDTSQISSNVAALFKMIGMAHIRFHFLRHLFQNFFILRWLLAFFPEVIPPDTPFLKFELFDEINMSNYRKYFLGFGPTKKGQEQFTNAMAVLSRTVGHAYCSVTESTYLHNIDWLFYLLSRHLDQNAVPLMTQQAQDLLQLSYYLLPGQFKGRGIKNIKLGDIAKAQSSFLKALFMLG